MLAFFFGWLGVHRFYLGQRGNGVAFLLLSFVGIGFLLGFIDFLVFLFMDEEKFDLKYNRVDRERRDYERPSRERYARRQPRQRDRRKAPTTRNRRKTTTVNKISQVQMHMRAAKEHFAAFDYFEAIAQWQKGLEFEPHNAAIHYNLACAYSLTENAGEGFHHLNEAIKAGFNNFEKLNQQDALAFLRIQPEFDDFVKNKYQLKENNVRSENPEEKAAPAPPATPAPTNILSKDILQQLKELGELRDRGILTEEEFIAQKKKLI